MRKYRTGIFRELFNLPNAVQILVLALHVVGTLSLHSCPPPPSWLPCPIIFVYFQFIVFQGKITELASSVSSPSGNSRKKVVGEYMIDIVYVVDSKVPAINRKMSQQRNSSIS